MIEIIAEAAQGFFGAPREKTALLARFAAAAGADAVKFQLVYADELCTPDYKHFALFRELEMPDEDWLQLAEHCRTLKVRLYVDVFGPRSLRIAERMAVSGIKIHSTDMLNGGLLRRVASSSIRRIILSAGGCLLGELDVAVQLMRSKDVVVMHGFQGYPTDAGENQIARIAVLKSRYASAKIGFADHVPESHDSRTWLAAVAVGAGAEVIEKHLTTAVVCREEDHESALAPDEFARFVANLRLAHEAFGAASGDADFGMTQKEKKYRSAMKKHVVAARDLPSGRLLSEDDIALKRTSCEGDVLHDGAQAIGRRLNEAAKADSAILRSMVD